MACLGCNGTTAKPFCSTSNPVVFIFLIWSCIRRTLFTSPGCSSFRRWPCFCLPPLRVAYGAALLVRKRSTPKSTCGSRKKSRATVLPACVSIKWAFQSPRSAKSHSSTCCGCCLASTPVSHLWAISRPFKSWPWHLPPCLWGLGKPFGCFSMALPPTAMPALCASRCANTCAPMPAFKAPCSTATP